MSYFVAQYFGACDGCGEPIRPGERIGYVEDELLHAGCVERGPAPKKAKEVCQECWLEKPCGCEDGQ